MKVVNLVEVPYFYRSIRKVFNIVQSDSELRFVVVSAPGKRANAEDNKSYRCIN